MHPREIIRFTARGLPHNIDRHGREIAKEPHPLRQFASPRPSPAYPDIPLEIRRIPEYNSLPYQRFMGARMKLTTLRLGVYLVTTMLVTSGCDDKVSGTSRGDADVSEAGLSADGSVSGTDLASILVDARDIAPTEDAPGTVPALDAADAALDLSMVADTPLGGPGEAGPSLAVDAEPAEVAGEAGSDVLPSSPDGGLACGLAGATCASAADCCGLACLSGLCAATACLSDGMVCAAGGECCGTVCGAGGTCVPLNPTCKTAGNACLTGAECCNGTCDANHQCASPGQVSYCAQAGDICRGDGECCTGVCNLAAGSVAGTCATLSTSCQIDGTLCNGCGSCCSHFCGPFGSGGPDICQPASGCHVQGDLCRRDSDCCGGDASSGLPGAGLIKCEPDPTYGSRIGTCGGPQASNCPNGEPTCKNSCNPEGNVCHFKETAVCAGDITNVRNNCCACVPDKECCQLDATGIPRCNTLDACVPAGGNCSFSGECCDHQPCLPDPVTGKLTCGSTCVPLGGACTTNGDCCVGMLCDVTPGALAGVCVIPPPPGTPDAGVPDSGPEDAPPICAYFGQACSVDVPCCGTTCMNADFAECTATDTDCVCNTVE